MKDTSILLAHEIRVHFSRNNFSGALGFERRPNDKKKKQLEIFLPFFPVFLRRLDLGQLENWEPEVGDWSSRSPILPEGVQRARAMAKENPLAMYYEATIGSEDAE